MPEVQRVDNVPVVGHSVTLSANYRPCKSDRGYVNTSDGLTATMATCYECGARVPYDNEAFLRLTEGQGA